MGWDTVLPLPLTSLPHGRDEGGPLRQAHLARQGVVAENVSAAARARQAGVAALGELWAAWWPTFGNIGVFNMVRVAPAAWWLYAFALGTAAGTLFRRTLPAMALVVGRGGGDDVHAVPAEHPAPPRLTEGAA
ncbi:hypothetical protein ABZ297_22685 [Nonomuraea sp. NPDC005983]|uniref:hypothetical protein n=1 Tax=Nonomuraea sp. NPDC005983 TaxID=3155595 RepID=UPI0033BBD877